MTPLSFSIETGEFPERHPSLVERKGALERFVQHKSMGGTFPLKSFPKFPKTRRYFKGKELYTDINPDEAVAYGATVQASRPRLLPRDLLRILLSLVGDFRETCVEIP